MKTMMFIRNYSAREIYKMVRPYIKVICNVTYEAMTTAIINAIYYTCGWLEILLLMTRWMAQQACAKWIPTALWAVTIARQTMEIIPVVAENLFYDTLDICSGLAVGFRKAWAFREELVKENKYGIKMELV